jgi:hypothetical protein
MPGIAPLQPAVRIPAIVTSLEQHLAQLEAEARAAHAALSQPGGNAPAVVAARFPQLAALARTIAAEARSTRDIARAEKRLQLEEKSDRIANDSEAISRGIEEARAKAQAATQAASIQLVIGIINSAAQMRGAVASASQSTASPGAAATAIAGGASSGNFPVAATPGGVSRAGPASLDQQVAQLQQQVQALQTQVAALQSVLNITSTGITIQSNDSLVLQSGRNITLNAGQSVGILGNAATIIEGKASLDLKAPLIKLNGGGKPLATVGSAVGNGKILTGSPTIQGN